MKKQGLTLTMFLLIILTDVGDSFSQLLMKRGLTETGIGFVSFSNALEFIFRNALSPWVWSGILLYSLTFFIWIVVLSRIDLSIALPVGSTSYILTPLMAILFLKENVPPLRWLGIMLIIAGMLFVSKSTQHASSNE